ncbi:MAG: DUF4440 domain-containing protein [Planctomycetaceae bacterium]
MADDTKALLELNQKLLNSIDKQDWKTYASLCDESITAFEPEALGQIVVGLPFHEFYFKLEKTGRPKQSTMASPHVRLMGDSAVISYVRVSQRVGADGVPSSGAAEETRVWQKQKGTWKHVHFHRSPYSVT